MCYRALKLKTEESPWKDIYSNLKRFNWVTECVSCLETDSLSLFNIGSTSQIDIKPEDSCFKRLMEHMDGFEGYVKCELPISYRGKLAMHIDKL